MLRDQATAGGNDRTRPLVARRAEFRVGFLWGLVSCADKCAITDEALEVPFRDELLEYGDHGAAPESMLPGHAAGGGQARSHRKRAGDDRRAQLVVQPAKARAVRLRSPQRELMQGRGLGHDESGPLNVPKMDLVWGPFESIIDAIMITRQRRRLVLLLLEVIGDTGREGAGRLPSVPPAAHRQRGCIH